MMTENSMRLISTILDDPPKPFNHLDYERGKSFNSKKMCETIKCLKCNKMLDDDVYFDSHANSCNNTLDKQKEIIKQKIIFEPINYVDYNEVRNRSFYVSGRPTPRPTKFTCLRCSNSFTLFIDYKVHSQVCNRSGECAKNIKNKFITQTNLMPIAIGSMFCIFSFKVLNYCQKFILKNRVINLNVLCHPIFQFASCLNWIRQK